jgi:hypothetical protein
MQSTYTAPVEVSPPLTVSTSVAAVGLFCLLGLAISVIVLPHIPAEHLGWVLAHLE